MQTSREPLWSEDASVVNVLRSGRFQVQPTNRVRKNQFGFDSDAEAVTVYQSFGVFGVNMEAIQTDHAITNRAVNIGNVGIPGVVSFVHNGCPLRSSGRPCYTNEPIMSLLTGEHLADMVAP